MVIDPGLITAGFQAASSLFGGGQPAAPAVSGGTQNVSAGLSNYGYTVATSGSRADPTISGNGTGGASPAAAATQGDAFASMAGGGISGVVLALVFGGAVLLAGRKKKS